MPFYEVVGASDSASGIRQVITVSLVIEDRPVSPPFGLVGRHLLHQSPDYARAASAALEAASRRKLERVTPKDFAARAKRSA